MRLRWDFATSFPAVSDDAIDAGRVQPEDTTPEAVAALHAEHAREMLAVLRRLDRVREAASHGVDAETGKRPRTPATQSRLAERHREEPARLTHAYQVLLDVYAEAFGDVAATAFDHNLRARHAGIAVVALARDRRGDACYR